MLAYYKDATPFSPTTKSNVSVYDSPGFSILGNKKDALNCARCSGSSLGLLRHLRKLQKVLFWQRLEWWQLTISASFLDNNETTHTSATYNS